MRALTDVQKEWLKIAEEISNIYPMNPVLALAIATHEGTKNWQPTNLTLRTRSPFNLTVPKHRARFYDTVKIKGNSRLFRVFPSYQDSFSYMMWMLTGRPNQTGIATGIQAYREAARYYPPNSTSPDIIHSYLRAIGKTYCDSNNTWADSVFALYKQLKEIISKC